MSTADRLRSLVKEATPGPWFVSHTSDFYSKKANARLLALAPQLAELVADMGEALDMYWKHYLLALSGEEKEQVTSALARLAALFPEDSA